MYEVLNLPGARCTIVRNTLPVVITILLAVIVSNHLHGQEESLDSLDKLLYQNISQSERIKVRNRMAAVYLESDPHKALDLLDKVIEDARAGTMPDELALALSNKGSVLNGFGEYAAALTCYLEAYNIHKSVNNTVATGFACDRLGFIYKNIGDYSKATEFCMEGLKIFEKLGKKDGLAGIYRVLGSIYKYQVDYGKSLYYYFEGLAIHEELDDRQGIANSFNNIGVVYYITGEYDKALGYYRRSLAINLERDNIRQAAINYGNIGFVYLRTDSPDSALIFFDLKYEAAALNNNPRIYLQALSAYGFYFAEKGNYDEAILKFQDALAVSRSIGTLENTKSILENLSEVYVEMGDYERAHNIYTSFVAVKDSLMNTEVSQRIRQLEMEYSFEKEKGRMELLASRRKLFTLLAFSFLGLSSLLFLLLFMNQKMKLKQRKLNQRKLEMDKRQLKYEITYKNKELTSNTIFLAQKNELINEMIGRLNILLGIAGDKNKGIREIVRDMKVHSNLKIWEEFEYIFVQVHPDFFEKLTAGFTDLTPNEKRLSALLRLNLSTKDISSITRQSVHSLTVARTRLRKKLGIANTGENLVTFLSQL